MAAILIALTLAALTMLMYTKLRRKRFGDYHGIPQLAPSLLLGNLGTIKKFAERGRRDRHPDHIFGEMMDCLGRPQMMLVDIWPIRDPLLIVSSHEVAEQLSRPSDLFPWGAPKWPSTGSDLKRLIGSKSLIAAGGEEWHSLRKKYNPSFSHQQLLTYMPIVLEKVFTFLDLLEGHVAGGDEFSLLEHCVDLAFDVIGRVAIGLDLEAQSPGQSKLARDYLELMATYDGILAVLPGWVVPFVELKRSRLENSIGRALSEHIDHTFSQHRKGVSLGNSILSMRLQGISSLTDEIIAETTDQLKTFLLAGRDTTGITLAWAIYELSRTPRALQAVRKEADAALGTSPDIQSVQARLAADRSDFLSRMPYTHAVVRETLRLHPPGGAMRFSSKNTGLSVRDGSTGESHCVDGLAVYLCEPLIHRDPAVYGDSADYFFPERWLERAAGEAEVPVSAWRPFERGPRGCIGKELAIMEVCLGIALACRRFDFTKVGMGSAVLDEKDEAVVDPRTGQFKVNTEIYKVLEMTAKPADGMRMNITAVRLDSL